MKKLSNITSNYFVSLSDPGIWEKSPARKLRGFIDSSRSSHLRPSRLVQPANFPNRLSIGRGCHLAGTLSEPEHRAPLFHKQKTAALRVMAVFFERPSANQRTRLAGAKYKRNRPADDWDFLRGHPSLPLPPHTDSYKEENTATTRIGTNRWDGRARKRDGKLTRTTWSFDEVVVVTRPDDKLPSRYDTTRVEQEIGRQREIERSTN